MKKLLTLFTLLCFTQAFSQTIDIGPNEYAFQYSIDNNFGLFFDATDGRYEFLNGNALPVFGFSAQNGSMTTNLEFSSGADYLVGNNRYAFRAKADQDYGLFFNATSLSYDFLSNSATSTIRLHANSGDISLNGFIQPGNTASNEEGAIRFTGFDLEGFVNNQWVSLTEGQGSNTDLQEGYDNDNSISTSNALPLAIEGPGGLIVSQVTPASTEGNGIKLFFDPSNGSFRCGSTNASAWDIDQRGSGSAGFGQNTIASGVGSFSAGVANTSSGSRAVSFGENSEAAGLTSFAAGSNNLAGADFSVAFGESNQATGTSSFAACKENIATSEAAAAFGRNTEATGDFSFTSGNVSKAEGSSSVAMGSFTNATGGVSAAFGFSNNSLGFCSFSAGQDCDASGDRSVAIGLNVDALGNNSFALGTHTEASSFGEMAIGTYNTLYSPVSTTEANNSDRLFVIGNGTGTSARSDAIVVLKNGKVGIGSSTPESKLTIDGVPPNTRGLDLLGDANYLGFQNWEIGRANNEGGPVMNGDLVFRNNDQPVFFMWDGIFAPYGAFPASLGSPDSRWFTLYAVNGTINTSDAREKKNIEEIDYGLETLMKLKPVSYEWKEDAMNIGSKLGFVAQDLLEVVPEVVVTQKRVVDRNTGEVSFQEAERMGVFYDDLIPVLAKAIQDQQSIIEKLSAAVEKTDEENKFLREQNERQQEDIDELKRLMANFQTDLQTCCFGSGSSESNGSTTNASPELGQNIPNPFSESTIIQYYLPENTANAIIRITDMNGSPVEDIRLGDQKGANQVEFHTQGLASGTYLYSLFVGGKFIATKKMVVTN